MTDEQPDNRSADVDVGAADRSGRAPAVEVTGVSKSFEAGVLVLDGIDLTVNRGEIVSVLGSSGCGKSTLLRIIAGLDRPDDGSVYIAGEDPDEVRRNHGLAMAFQQPGLLEWRDTAANIELPMQLAGWEPARRAARVEELLEMVGLAGIDNRAIWELSGGMQQRVALARSLALSPQLLLLDEPFGALDEITRERLHGELLSVQQATGTTVIMVTHSVSEAITLGDRTAVMSAHPGRFNSIFDTSAESAPEREKLRIRARSALER